MSAMFSINSVTTSAGYTFLVAMEIMEEKKHFNIPAKRNTLEKSTEVYKIGCERMETNR